MKMLIRTRNYKNLLDKAHSNLPLDHCNKLYVMELKDTPSPHEPPMSKAP